MSRSDNMRSMTESFEHDALDRLTRIYDDRGHDQSIEYDAVGNIKFKTGLGRISYYDTSNRIRSISGGTYTLPDVSDITYTSFNKITGMVHDMSTDVDLIYDGLTLSYGVDKTRNLERIVHCNSRKFCGQQENAFKVLKTKYYVGSLYEKETQREGTREIDYIYADGRNVAIHESSDTEGEKFLYLHRDHIGSVMAYTDDIGNLVEETSYDAWGRKRNPETWNAYGFSNDSISTYDNGFTGHEHIDLFDMVNMDGRMYDPVLGRFMTPDPIVQMPDFTQSLNRYSYCMNNPLSLTDPTGYNWLGDTFAAVVGIAVSIETLGISSLGNYCIIASCALGGAFAALLSSVINGANSFQVAKNTFQPYRSNYFLRTSDMRIFFQKKWGVARIISKYLKIKNGIVFQSGFQGVTGHVDIFYSLKSVT